MSTSFLLLYVAFSCLITSAGCQSNYAVSQVACSSSLQPYNYNTETGFILSPNYPLSYGSNADCRWLIAATEGFVVLIRFVDFATESNYDYVRVYDNAYITSTTVASLDGLQSSRVTYQTTQRYMLVRFTSDSSVVSRGFKATFWTTTMSDARVACSYWLQPYKSSAQTGFILSPNYPQPYSSYADCQWLISAPSNGTVQISFTDFSTLPGNDYVYIYDGPYIWSPSIYSLSGTLYAPIISTTQRYMLLRLKSSYGSNGLRRFNATFVTTYSLDYSVSRVACSSSLQPYNYDTQTGFISSPNYPQSYGNNSDCRWLIAATPDNAVSIRFTDFFTESCCDYVYIYDGIYVTSTTIALLAGSQSSSLTYTTTQRYMLVRFSSDGSSVFRGFNATFWTISIGDAVSRVACSSSLQPYNYDTPTGIISSPNLLLISNAGADCRWLISAPLNYLVNIRLTDFSTASGNGYVYLHDGQSTSAPLISSLSGNYYYVHSYNTTQRYMLVRYATTYVYGYGYKGFNATFRTIYMGKRHADDFSVPTPSYPNIAVRLVDGQRKSEGRLEVRYNNGSWGTLCDRGFSNNDATVTCHSLGYRYGGKYLHIKYGRGLGVIYKTNFSCTGSEFSLAECPHSLGEWICNVDYFALSISCDVLDPPPWISGVISAVLFIVCLSTILISLRYQKITCRGACKDERTTVSQTNPETQLSYTSLSAL